jgi:hypothetical protein
MIPCVCINDANKPNEILIENWIKRDIEYTINFITYHPNQGIQGVQLVEVKPRCEKYESYKISRFKIRKQDLEALLELAKLCSDLDDISLDDLFQNDKILVDADYI